jgi:hypothetical protein
MKTQMTWARIAALAMAVFGLQGCGAPCTDPAVCGCSTGWEPYLSSCRPICESGKKYSGGKCVFASSGDLTIDWTFLGNSCVPAGVAQVKVKLTGRSGLVSLDNGGLFPCSVGGVDGVTLKAVPGGDYLLELNDTGGGGYKYSSYLTVDTNVSAFASLTR